MRLCDHVRYEVGGVPFHPTVCHCSMCRRAVGAPMVAWFSVPRAEYRLVAGTPARFAFSAKGTRTFCTRCGTPLAFESGEHPSEINITNASLDDPGAVPPRDHTRAPVQLGWVRLADGPLFILISGRRRG